MLTPERFQEAQKIIIAAEGALPDGMSTAMEFVDLMLASAEKVAPGVCTRDELLVAWCVELLYVMSEMKAALRAADVLRGVLPLSRVDLSDLPPPAKA